MPTKTSFTTSGSSWPVCRRAFLSGSLLEPFCRSSAVSVLFVPWFFLLSAGLPVPRFYPLIVGLRRLDPR